MVEQLQEAEYVDIDASKVMSGEFDMYQMRLKDGRKIHFLIFEELGSGHCTFFPLPYTIFELLYEVVLFIHYPFL